ncbi:hypothetical protein [Massiliimalia timonensis]|uniref:hypothetical protein n=1 Tax=Massiliimalia timonensis TaxID=1987501 RepID=UPI000B8B5497|nr:hypothetical protein [Massiliimalia timonensis]MBS7175545.1 hypothetical protein [Clostridiales bacterium]
MKQSETKLFSYFDTWLKDSVYGYVATGIYICYSCAVNQLKAVLKNEEINQIAPKEYQAALNQLTDKGYSHSTISKARTVI